MPQASAPRIDWPAVVEHSAAIVESYSTGVTLRQLFYRLVSQKLIPNTQNAYKSLSRHTAVARREGWFPSFIDRGRTIHRYRTFQSPEQASKWLKRIYRRPRDEHQEWSIYVGVEKSGIVEQLQSWFGNYGIGIVALGGYASQSYVDEIVTDVERQERPAVFIYAGDFDPSGEDIERDFVERTGCWTERRRIALKPAQIQQYNLPPLPGKSWDARAAGFVARHGQLMQVELDALDPNILRQLYADAVAEYWDDDAWQESIDQEREEERRLKTGEIVLDLTDARDLAAAGNPLVDPALVADLMRIGRGEEPEGDAESIAERSLAFIERISGGAASSASAVGRLLEQIDRIDNPDDYEDEDDTDDEEEDEL